MRLLRAVGPVTLLLSALAACAGGSDASAGAGTPRTGGTVVIVSTDDLDHANPLVTSTRYTQEILRYALFLPLVRYDAGLDLVPALARAWEVEGDTAVVFHLRDDVRWHDGRPTTAYDVAFTFQRILDPGTASPGAERLSGWGDAAIIDSFTVRFPVSRPEPMGVLPLVPIVPRHLLDTIPPERMRQAEFNRSPIGNGPFRFVEHRSNDRWVFEANPEFPEALGGRPRIDRLFWRIVPDGAAQVAEVRTGNAHLALGTTVEQSVEAVRAADLRLIVRPSRQFGFVGWNGRRPPLDDPRVRRAFALSIDRQELIDGLRSGHGTLADGPVGPWHWAYDPEGGGMPYAPDSARTLLDAAGIVDRDGDGLRDRPDGSPLRLELKVPAGNAFNRDLGEMIAADLRAAGIALELRPTETGTLIQDVTSPARAFDAFLYGWETDFRLDVRDLYHSAGIDGPLQFAAYRNPAVDSLIDRLATEYDRAAATAAWRRLQRQLRDDQPWTYLYYYPDVYITSARLHGADMDIRGALVNVSRWWLEGPVQTAGAEAK